mmetsp:Transcript_122199/g.182559  ORF Transcript_122199/g.182559 Transcript_122199/m.182559 type:complete len:867 (+) Transcript_122199:404-3004(+)
MTTKTDSSNSSQSELFPTSNVEEGTIHHHRAPEQYRASASVRARNKPPMQPLPQSPSYKSLAIDASRHPDDDNLDASTRSYAPPQFVSKFYCVWVSRWHHMAVKTPLVLLCLLLFLVLCGTSIAICVVVGHAKADAMNQEALDLAVETGEWFSNQLDQAILPLFSLAQFTAHLDLFQKLPQAIGPAYQPGSVPMIEGTFHRNVTGVCDDPELVDRFTSIATGVKKMANMDGILVNIQLAPQGVLCLLHPMNNTEDFEDGKFLDSTGAWGLDLFEDPFMKFIATNSIMNDHVGVAGPLTLIQCPTCDPFFIARLPIVDETSTILVNGVEYPRWGFATALIDWSKLVDRSGIYDTFASSAFEFQLTRTDTFLNQETGDFEEKIVVLAKSFDFTEPHEGKVRNAGFVSTSLETTNNEWVLTVQYDTSSTSMWLVAVVSACVVVSFCVSYLVFTVLRQKQTHAEMTADTVTQQAMISTERNMTAYFAHELRNPLSALDNALRTLNAEDKGTFSENTQELIDGMQLCSTFMSSIMNNLLDVRKLEEGKMAFRPEPILLESLIEDSHRMMKAAVREGVEFKTVKNLPANGRWVMADSHRIQQVLSNVLSNAIKYTLEGSITLTVAWMGNLVRFECIDTGPGIPKSEQEKLFERFVQRGGAPGTGLGLNIARQIVRMMRGTIEFVSDPTVRRGTTCRILLPLEVYQPPPEDNNLVDHTTSSKSGSNSGSGDSSSDSNKKVELIQEPISVLIMDDIKMNRSMLKRRLQKAVAPNADLVLVSTGEEALRVCRERSFDIIICDQYMEEAGGVMLGTDTIIAMRREKMNSFIIGCSGNDLNEQFKEAGADMVWGKPMPCNDDIIQQFREGYQRKKNK